MKFQNAIVVVIVLGSIAAGASWGAGKWLEKSAAPIDTIVVTEQTLDRHVSAEGYLKAEKATPLLAPRGWKPYKIAWLVPDGSRVKSGDIVVRFNQDELTRELANGRDDRDSAEARISSQRIRSATSNKTRIQAARLAEIDLKTARLRAKDESSELFSRNEIIKSQIDGQLSEAKVNHANTTSRVDRKISGSTKKLIELERKRALLTIQQAQDGLARMEILAPHDGIFVYKNSEMKLGDRLYGGQTIGELPLVDKMEAEVFVVEADAMGLETGKEAILFLESHPSKKYKATIKKVASLAQPRQEDTPTQYFAVTLELESTDAAVMKPGQRVRATISLESKQAILLPRQCVFNVDNEWIVYKQERGEFTAQKVVLGSGTPGRIEIKEGIAVGDIITTRDPHASSSDEDPEAGKDEKATDAP